MMMHPIFMKVNKKGKALAIKLSEECGELVQQLCKYANEYGDREKIEHEMGDVLGLCSMLIDELHLDKKNLESFTEKRIKKTKEALQKLD
jgi:NTP pyrophosphatase (non-canonical NTP hydrolase)